MNRMASERGVRSLPKQVWQLGWISFFADICSEMAYPVLALFIAALGAGPAALGIVEGVAESIVSFMKGASGVRTDVTGKRVPYIQAGYGLSALGKPLIALATGWPLVLVARSLDRFGKGIRTTARDTLIVDSTPSDRMGAAFGLHRGLDTAGAFVGVLLTLALLYLLQGNDQLRTYRMVFAIAFVPGIVSMFFTFRVKEAAHPEEAVKARQEGVRFNLSMLPPGYWRAVAISSTFALANSSDTFLILRAHQVFDAQYGVKAAAMLPVVGYAVYNAVYTVLSYPSGALSDRIGRWWVLGIGWLIYAAVYAGFSVASAGLLWVLFGLYGVYMGMTDGVGKALVADHAPRQARGSAMGLFYMISGFATLATSILTGTLWNLYGPRVAFGFGACIAVVAVAMIPLLSTKNKASAPTV
jgi:MFS family permease